MWVWWCILALGRPKQEDCEDEPHLGNLAMSHERLSNSTSSKTLFKKIFLKVGRLEM